PFMDSDALIRHFLYEENALFLAIDEAIADECILHDDRSYYLTMEDLINVVGFEWDQNGKKIHASELAWQQYMQFNPLAAWFKGRRLSIRNDLVNLFKDWGSA
ncbi:hypothetical protein Taro_036525, partial [Colocasia esculenta]|nr:hypothetical protein [Colocasia esculenta]